MTCYSRKFYYWKMLVKSRQFGIFRKPVRFFYSFLTGEIFLSNFSHFFSSNIFLYILLKLVIFVLDICTIFFSPRYICSGIIYGECKFEILMSKNVWKKIFKIMDCRWIIYSYSRPLRGPDFWIFKKNSKF